MEAELQCTAFCSRRLTHHTIVSQARRGLRGRVTGAAWAVHGRGMGGAWAVHGRVMGAAWARQDHGEGVGWARRGRRRVRVIKRRLSRSLKQNETLWLHAFLEVTSQDGGH